jgi:hypothetical protein
MNNFIFTFILSLFFMLSQSSAYTFKKVAQGKILVRIDAGENAEIGDEYAVYQNQMLIVKAKVLLVKNGKFVARITEGSIDSITEDLYPKLVVSKSQAGAGKFSRKIKLAFNLGFNMNQITVKQYNALLSSSESVAMNGSDMSFELNTDYMLSDKWGVFAGLGYESFKVSGQASGLVCAGTATRDCFVDLKYITGTAGLKYYIDKSYGTYWLGLGAKLKSPISKSSNSVNEVDLTYAHGVLVNAGLEYKTSSKLYIPAGIIYNHSLNTSDTVTQIQNIGFTIGIGKSF